MQKSCSGLENCECDDCTGAYTGPWYGHPPLRNSIIAGVFVGTGLVLGQTGMVPPFIEKTFFLIAIFIGAYHWAREGIEELLHEHVIGIEILMLAATAGSLFLGLWGEGALLVTLYAAAEGVEELTYARTRASIRSLLTLAPTEAVLLENGAEKLIPARDLKIGEVFLVKPGAKIPTDGVIIKGRSSINEATVTGEAVPVEKDVGMKVFAATLNGEGILEARATETFENNTLAKIIHLVEEAQEQKGKTQLFIDRFGRIYTPVVLLVSLLIIFIPPLFGIPFNDLAVRGVVLLVAAAPCALIMSTPVAIAAGIGSAGKHGILIKGGSHLENLGKIKVIAFDKTGTLTTGNPVLTDIITMGGSTTDVLRIAYSVEKCSEHPLARAINKKALDLGIEAADTTGECALPGQGAAAYIGGVQYLVGKPESFNSQLFEGSFKATVENLRSDGKTVMFIGTRERLIGIIAVRDQVRPEAKTMINRIREMGIGVIMLTGDNAVTAKAIASDLNIDKIRTDLQPDAKIREIDALIASYGEVAMIGDGINDAPALASATVGIAMGTIGTDAAVEAADVALMADDLTKVPEAIRYGRKAVSIGNQNITFSLIVLAIMIPAALFGVLGVTAAVILHEASELIAVANGLRVATT